MNRRPQSKEQAGNRPTRQAVALRYDPGVRDAPFVVAVGRGYLAERIIAAAREKGIPVHDDPALAAALSRLPINQEIPPELYLVVARILAYLLRAESRAAGHGLTG